VAKKRRQLISPTGSNIPTGAKMQSSGYDPDLWNTLKREEQAAKEAPMRKALGDLNSALQENAKNVAAFFSLSPDALLSRSIPESATDFGIGEFPLATEVVLNPDAADRNDMFLQFAESLDARGNGLTHDGVVRLSRYVKMLEGYRKFALSLELLEAAFVRLTELKCWGADEVSGELPKRVAPQQELSQETERQKRQRVERQGIEDISTETRETREQCLKFIGEMWNYDVECMYRQWAEQMERDWHVDVLTPKITKFAGDWFQRYNKNPLDKTGTPYNELRVVLSNLGMLGCFDCRTKDEKLAAGIENSNLDDRSVRQTIAQHTKEIIAAGLGKKGGVVFES
jgi:hypothetical protein